MISVAGAESVIEISLWSWNRFSSNSLLGTALVKLSAFKHNVFHDTLVPLDTQGEIQLFLFVAPYPSPLAISPMSEKLLPLRILLENSVYYPGSVVRGIVILRVANLRKLFLLQLELDGCSSVRWAHGKHNFYSSTQSYLNARIPLIGHLGIRRKDEQPSLLSPGLYIFPFEFTLPMELPPSFHDTMCNASIRYQARASVDNRISGPGEYYFVNFRVLSNPNTFMEYVVGKMPLEEQKAAIEGVKGALTKSSSVLLEVLGPPIAYIGELYAVKVRLENHSAKPIESLTAYLRMERQYHGQLTGDSWKLRTSIPRWYVVEKWCLSTLPGFPVAPGATWEGEVQCQLSASLATSMPATLCPNIQVSYRFQIKVATAGNMFTKAQGKSKYGLFLAQHNLAYPRIIPPTSLQGALNQIWISSPPHDPSLESRLTSLLPPGRSRDGITLPVWGPSIGSIPKLSSAKLVPHFSWDSNCMDWTHGSVPSWIKP